MAYQSSYIQYPESLQAQNFYGLAAHICPSRQSYGGFPFPDQVATTNMYQSNPQYQNNLMSSTYNSEWRDYSDLRCGNNFEQQPNFAQQQPIQYMPPQVQHFYPTPGPSYSDPSTQELKDIMQQLLQLNQQREDAALQDFERQMRHMGTIIGQLQSQNSQLQSQESPSPPSQSIPNLDESATTFRVSDQDMELDADLSSDGNDQVSVGDDIEPQESPLLIDLSKDSEDRYVSVGDCTEPQGSPISIEQTQLDLKPLPDHLKYAYLGEDQQLPIIIAQNPELVPTSFPQRAELPKLDESECDTDTPLIEMDINSEVTNDLEDTNN